MSSKRSGVGRLQVALPAIALATVLAGCSQGASERPPAGASTELPAGYARLVRGILPKHLEELDRGPLDPSRRISNLSLAFKLSPAQIADREALKAALTDKRSPLYRKFLKPADYAARFGAPLAVIERTKAWLGSQGLDVHEDSPLGARVTFSGTVERLQTAFRAEMHAYEVEGESHYAMRAPPALPADLAAVTAEISNTHDFHPKPMVRFPRVPAFTQGKQTGFAPPDWANVYDVTPLYTAGPSGKPVDGTGVNIAIVGVADISQTDVDAWRKTFNLAPSTITKVLVPNTGASAGGMQGAGFEAMLDVEWSGGMAPGASVTYVYIGATDQNVDDATYYAIDMNLGDIVSESFGGCEGYYIQSGITSADQNLVDIYASAANLLGITYVAASGDAGATTCLAGGGGIGGLYVSLPAAYPGVTAVGGTEFKIGSLSGSPYFSGYGSNERAWNESGNPNNLAAGGGGVSLLFDRPSYQASLPACAMVGSLPVGGVNPSSQRMVPDVAFTSAEGQGTLPELMECTMNPNTQDCYPAGGAPKFFGAGGTSFATPAFAGVVALLQQAAGGRLGNINPMLYDIASTSPSAFHDITLGSNEVQCMATDPGCGAGNQYGYPATTGYDCATGLGSMDVTNLVTAMAGRAATTTALALVPTTTTEAMPVLMTATVTVPMPNANNVGGEVSFVFESYDQTGALDLSWTVGTGTLSGSMANGTATFMGLVPPGLARPGMQSVDVVAMYAGDDTHLPSVSPKSTLSFGPLAFAIMPAMPTVPTSGMLQLTTTGGVSPVKWLINTDTTCDMSMPPNCSSIIEGTGALTVGPVAGHVQVFALDADGAEAMVNVTVVCKPATCTAKQCGTLSDGCGGMITCTATCTAPESCGGGTDPNGCGCTPLTSCPSSALCGTSPDGCGGTVLCGTCPTGQTCIQSQCVASTESASSSSGGTGGSAGTGGAGATSSTSSSSSSSGRGPASQVNKGCGCVVAGAREDDAPRPALGLFCAALALASRRRRRCFAAPRSTTSGTLRG